MASFIDRLRSRQETAERFIEVAMVPCELAGRDAVHGLGFELETGSAFDAPPGMWNTEVAGVSHRHQALQGDGLQPLQRVLLRPEPANAYDGNAVAVYDASGQVMVGYVPRDLARDLRPLLASGGRLYGLTTLEWRHRETGDRVGIRLLVSPQPVKVRIG
jgi:hypothetical protein